MEGEKSRNNKKGSHRRKQETVEFDPEITLLFDEFYRNLSCYYPNKNKDEIINKILTGNMYWITLDAQYYPQDVNNEVSKVELIRKKSLLKNGAFPPTKDALEEDKFILYVRRIVSKNQPTLNLSEIHRLSMVQLLQYLEQSLLSQERENSEQLQAKQEELKKDTIELHKKLEELGITPKKAARMFAYADLEKQVIDQSVEKHRLKERLPRCDFCFIRDKETIRKCLVILCQSQTCDLSAHPPCFSKATREGDNFQCDQCTRDIPQNAQCQLCPLIGGRFLELDDLQPQIKYQFSKGDSHLKFKIQAIKVGTSRRFLHVSCFVLHPECTYNLETGKVEGFHLIDRSKKNNNICLLCGNMIGLTVPCANQSCRRAYHPECAKRNNLKINVIKANNKSLLEIYCDRHKKPESFEYLKDSVVNRIRQLRKFYENLDYEIKRHGTNHPTVRQKKQAKIEDNLKMDFCLKCSQDNDFSKPISNCKRCYGWRHDSCSSVCPYCDPFP